MKQWHRPHLIARHLQRASVLALGAGFSLKGLKDIAQHKQGHVLVGRGYILERPLTAIESLKGAQESFGGIGGGWPPGRANGGKELGELGTEPSDDGLGWAILGFGLELCHASVHRALRGGVKEGLEFG